MSSSEITIELTRSQVARVVRRASQGDDLPGRVDGLLERGVSPSKYQELADSPRLSRSLLLGLLVLASFPADGESLAVTDVAERVGMSPSTTHRYMITLLAAELLEQDPRTRRYRAAGRGL